MSDWAVFFLGVIALATLATAVMQIGLIVYASRLARQLTTTVARVSELAVEMDRELKPLLASANVVGRDAARVASLALTQMERADRMFGELATGVDTTVRAVQRTAAVLSPAREWTAILRGLRAGFVTFRRLRRPERRAGEDEEALFI